jgi:hypothetical protein
VTSWKCGRPVSVLFLQVPRPLKTYHLYMKAVDKGDQGRLHMGGFARKAHFQKWYKKSFFAVLDFMLMNSICAWNQSCALIPGRQRFKRFEFFMWVVEDLLKFDDSEEDVPPEEPLIRSNCSPRNPKCVLVAPTVAHNKCIVCRLDSGYSGKWSTHSQPPTIRTRATNDTRVVQWNDMPRNYKI